MANTHTQPDTLVEYQYTWGDLGPAIIIGYSGLTVPASSLTLPGVAAYGYVLTSAGPGRLVFVLQDAVSLTLSGGDGTFWLALHTDLSTDVAGWTRRAGSHYVWQMNATQPARPTNGLVFAQITVAGGVITTAAPLAPVTSPPLSKQNSHAVAITGGSVTGITDLAVADGGTGASTASTARTNLGLGTMAEQHANAVTVTGGVVTGLSSLTVSGGSAFGGAASFNNEIRMPFNATVGNGGPIPSVFLSVHYQKAAIYGMSFHPSDGDAGGAQPVSFLNAAAAIIGSISTTGSATAFNTSSDARLKRNITPLTAALDRVRALRPVEFLWTSDDSPGVGFVADEVAQVVDGVITGEADAVDEAGEIVPQQIDHSKLVPWLTAALKETLAQVEALTARVAALEAALA